MSDNLDKLTDAELNEVFAAEVAGFTFESVHKDDARFVEIVKIVSCGQIVASYYAGNNASQRETKDDAFRRAGIDKFSTSFDAVLPLMCGQFVEMKNHHSANNMWRVRIECPETGRTSIGEHDALARAACAALILHARAKGEQ